MLINSISILKTPLLILIFQLFFSNYYIGFISKSIESNRQNFRIFFHAF